MSVLFIATCCVLLTAGTGTYIEHLGASSSSSYSTSLIHMYFTLSVAIEMSMHSKQCKASQGRTQQVLNLTLQVIRPLRLYLH